jgi:hypothetical protein
MRTLLLLAALVVVPTVASANGWHLKDPPSGRVVGDFAYESQCYEAKNRLARDAIIHWRSDEYSKLEVDLIAGLVCTRS